MTELPTTPVRKPAPHRRPERKVNAAGLAGAVTVILVGVAGRLGLEIQPEESAALTLLIAYGAGYLRRG